MLQDPGVGPIQNFGEQQQVVTAEVLRFAPEVTVAIQASHCHVVSVAGFSLIEPNFPFEVADSDAVITLLRHGNVPVKQNEKDEIT